MKKLPALFLFALVASVGCNRVPGHVIPPDDMAEIMADLNTAEAVAETNHAMFPNDSTRRVLRQSIYMAHGITEADFDSSMMWYGRNIDRYVEMCELTIETQKRVKRNSACKCPTAWECLCRAILSMSGNLRII